MGIGRAAVGVLLEKVAAGPFFGRDLQRSAHHLSDRSGGRETVRAFWVPTGTAPPDLRPGFFHPPGRMKKQ
jgi:hypothetical protein